MASASGASSQDLPWHVLQYSDALDLEFASALAEFAPVTLWKPERHLLVHRRSSDMEQPATTSKPQVQTFAVQRGFARFPLSLLSRTGPAITRRLLRQASDPSQPGVLVCTTPFFAPVAERWPGPVVYWLTDLIAHYEGARFGHVRALDRRMCRSARLICPNSERIATYLRQEAGASPDRVHVLPNATGVRSLLPAPLMTPMAVPEPFGSVQRPLAGVIGNLAENTDWLFLHALLELTPWLSWLFVGPTHGRVRDRAQRTARAALLRHSRACFTGPQPYRALGDFARALDVAVLPYCRREPTFSGSSTRFYDHLAACHPILGTPAVAELQGKEPLLHLVANATEAARALEQLRAAGFDDGQRAARWQASQQATWRARARTMQQALYATLQP